MESIIFKCTCVSVNVFKLDLKSFENEDLNIPSSSSLNVTVVAASDRLRTSSSRKCCFHSHVAKKKQTEARVCYVSLNHNPGNQSP